MSNLHEDLFEAGGVAKKTEKKSESVIKTESDILHFSDEKKPVKLINKKIESNEKKQDNNKTESIETEVKKASTDEKTVKIEDKPAAKEKNANEVKPKAVLQSNKSDKYEKTQIQMDVSENSSSHLQQSTPNRTLTHGEITPGQILQEARVRLNLGLDQVSIRTKISKQYIEAIERNEFSALPAPVFTTAYLRTLCDCYKIKNREAEILHDFESRQKNKPVPEAILEQIHRGRQVNMDEEKKITALMTGIIVFVLAIILAGTLSYIYYQHYVKDEGSTKKILKQIDPATKQVDPELNKAVSLKIKKNFQYSQFINMTELELEGKKTQHK